VGQYTVSGTVVPAGASAPAAPSNLSASAASSSSINLSWTDNSANEDGFKIERLVNGTWAQVATVGADVTSWQETGLAAGTSYNYRVRAYNAAGASASSNTASATTNAAASAPSAPTNLAASVRTKPRARVTLSWTDTSSNETGFYVDRSTDGGATWVRIAQLAANATSYGDDSVSSGKTYLYRACAYNGMGNSGYSNAVSVTVGGGSTKRAPAAALPLGGPDLPGPAGDALLPAGQETDRHRPDDSGRGAAARPAQAAGPDATGFSTGGASSAVQRERTQAAENLPSRPATPGQAGGLSPEALLLYLELGGTFSDSLT
jgi:hypothetical protein